MTDSQVMVGSADSPMPDFAAFYHALNGREAFPWQVRLANQVGETDTWPTEVGVPTGLGKTACLDIALWWLASQAHRVPSCRSAPTRIWWVVNRRLLVDSTMAHAKKIADTLSSPTSFGLESDAAETIAAVGDRLRSLSASSSASAVEVLRLRGGVETRTPTDPSQPAVILSTLPMYGSRLLFRGYGSSRNGRPIDAAMAGTDSLVLLDEAHLAPHLRTLCDALEKCARPSQEVLPQSRSWPQLVAMTATGGEPTATRFDLDDRDFAHPEVSRRVKAPKPVELRECDAKEVAPKLAEAMTDLLDGAQAPTAAVVFANTPKTARQVFQRLRKLLASRAEVLLLTGRVREREAEQVRSRILDPADGMASANERRSRDRHLVIVATQTLEVGADIDAEYLVTEACGVRALTQRFGRLNRLGRYGHARAVYLHAPPPPRRRGTPTRGAPEWPVYGQEPEVVWRRLREAVSADGSEAEGLDLGPAAIKDILGVPGDNPGRAPEVLYGLLWEWIKTTTPPHGEAPVEPFFSGITGADRMVSVMWRSHIPDIDGDLAGEHTPRRLWPRTRDHESVSVPIWEFLDAMEADEKIHRVASDRVTVERVDADDLRPGDSVLLAADRGLLDEFGWEPSSAVGVVDVSLPGHGLPLDAVAIRRLCGVAVPDKLLETAHGIVAEDGDYVDPAEQRAAGEQIVGVLREAATPSGWDQGEWASFLDSLSPVAVSARGEVARLRVEGSEDARRDELDEMSLTEQVESLDRHGEDVATRARGIANRLGVPTDLIEAVARAGLLHDLGKADDRFQRWLDPKDDHPGITLAKSSLPRHRWNAARAQAGWPRGGRHETLSAGLVSRWLELDSEWGATDLIRELLVHLVLSHHGRGRPLVPPVTDALPAPLAVDVCGHYITMLADLSEVDWTQPARFWRLNSELGPWGLALLESIVRLSDHAVSGRDATLPTRATT